MSERFTNRCDVRPRAPFYVWQERGFAGTNWLGAVAILAAE